MIPRVHQLATGAYALVLAAAGWAQIWPSDRCLDLHQGSSAYVMWFDRTEPRGSGSGTLWCVQHAHSPGAAGGGIAWVWTDGEAVAIWWADAPTLHPIQRLEWAGPADWDVDGDVDVFDLIAYLDGWFAEPAPSVDRLVEWVGVWFEGGGA